MTSYVDSVQKGGHVNKDGTPYRAAIYGPSASLSAHVM